MNIFTNPASGISQIKKILATYPNVAQLLENRDYTAWEQKLSVITNNTIEVFNGNFNLLSLLALAVYETNESNGNRGLAILRNFEKWLGMFPELIADNNFKGKIKNLSQDSFLSTLSELVVAAQFKGQGYTVKFEHKFTLVRSNGNRDIDLTVTDSKGRVSHLEIYAPQQQVVEAEFADPNLHDHSFKRKVTDKQDKKFGTGGFTGLQSNVLLAIDIAKTYRLYMKSHVPVLSNDDIYLELGTKIADNVDGFVFFQSDFASEQSFKLEKMILKPHVL